MSDDCPHVFPSQAARECLLFTLCRHLLLLTRRMGNPACAGDAIRIQPSGTNSTDNDESDVYPGGVVQQPPGSVSAAEPSGGASLMEW